MKLKKRHILVRIRGTLFIVRSVSTRCFALGDRSYFPKTQTLPRSSKWPNSSNCRECSCGDRISTGQITGREAKLGVVTVQRQTQLLGRVIYAGILREHGERGCEQSRSARPLRPPLASHLAARHLAEVAGR